MATRPSHPPEAWAPARRVVRAAIAPIEHFLHVAAAGGIVLFVVAAIALFWASSPWASSYQALLHAPISLRLGPFAFDHDVHFVVNEGLMTLFFFVVGLEIKREMAHGELQDLKRAALPLAAALGGMIVPAAIYVALNPALPARDGWGVPMSTDIAFAVGVLALLGPRVAPALRVLLLTLAIADDVGAVLVIALVYSSGIAWSGIAIAAAGLALVVAMQKIGVRKPWLYVLPTIVTWHGLHSAGVHPTLAGVLVGILTPARAWLGPEGFVEVGRRAIDRVEAALGLEAAPSAEKLTPRLDELQAARREAVSPAERLLHVLHPWVAFVVMPIFALANAGVPILGVKIEASQVQPMLGVILGLVVGKPLGVFAASWIAVKLGLARLPRGVRWGGVIVVGAVAGIGFTMAIFVGGLAFPPELLETAKLAILIASAVAAVFALALGRIVLTTEKEPGEASTASEAEASAIA